MKALFYFLLCIGFVFSSCGKEDDCIPGTLATVIVGEWDVKALGIHSGAVEFLADGTLLDPDDALIGAEINGVVLDEKSYVVYGDTLFTATAAKGAQSFEFEFVVTDFGCNKIEIDLFGFPGALERK